MVLSLCAGPTIRCTMPRNASLMSLCFLNALNRPRRPPHGCTKKVRLPNTTTRMTRLWMRKTPPKSVSRRLSLQELRIVSKGLTLGKRVLRPIDRRLKEKLPQHYLSLGTRLSVMLILHNRRPPLLLPGANRLRSLRPEGRRGARRSPDVREMSMVRHATLSRYSREGKRNGGK